MLHARICYLCYIHSRNTGVDSDVRRLRIQAYGMFTCRGQLQTTHRSWAELQRSRGRPENDGGACRSRHNRRRRTAYSPSVHHLQKDDLVAKDHTSHAGSEHWRFRHRHGHRAANHDCNAQLHH